MVVSPPTDAAAPRSHEECTPTRGLRRPRDVASTAGKIYNKTLEAACCALLSPAAAAPRSGVKCFRGETSKHHISLACLCFPCFCFCRVPQRGRRRYFLGKPSLLPVTVWHTSTSLHGKNLSLSVSFIYFDSVLNSNARQIM